MQHHAVAMLFSEFPSQYRHKLSRRMAKQS